MCFCRDGFEAKKRTFLHIFVFSGPLIMPTPAADTVFVRVSWSPVPCQTVNPIRGPFSPSFQDPGSCPKWSYLATRTSWKPEEDLMRRRRHLEFGTIAIGTTQPRETPWFVRIFDFWRNVKASTSSMTRHVPDSYSFRWFRLQWMPSQSLSARYVTLPQSTL